MVFLHCKYLNLLIRIFKEFKSVPFKKAYYINCLFAFYLKCGVKCFMNSVAVKQRFQINQKNKRHYW